MDSEPEEPTDILDIEYTDISEPASEPASDSHDDRVNKELVKKIESFQNSNKSIDKLTTQPIGRIQVTNRKPKTVNQAKALAQYSRKVTARVDKCKGSVPIQIPYPTIITDSAGRPVQLAETEVVHNEKEIIQQADQAIFGKNIVDVALDLIHEQQLKHSPMIYQGVVQGHNQT